MAKATRQPSWQSQSSQGDQSPVEMNVDKNAYMITSEFRPKWEPKDPDFTEEGCLKCSFFHRGTPLHMCVRLIACWPDAGLYSPLWHHLQGGWLDVIHLCLSDHNWHNLAVRGTRRCQDGGGRSRPFRLKMESQNAEGDAVDALSRNLAFSSSLI